MTDTTITNLPRDTIRGGVHTDLRHDSAIKHVTGRAEYCDDIAEPAGTLHAYLGLSERAHARIVAVDLDPVRSAPGVVGGADRRRHSRRERCQPDGPP